MRASLVDVSKWQGNVDVGRVASAGFSGLVSRCTIGLSLDTPNLSLYKRNQQLSRDLGLLFGAYHVLWPSNKTPIGEADWFLSNCGDVDMLVLDVELSHSLAKSQVQAQAKKWLDHVKNVTGRTPIVYTGSWWWNVAAGWENQYPLWEAEYILSSPRGGIKREQQPEEGGPSFVGWNDWAFWQWTSGGDPLGAQSESMDYNVFNGTEAELRAFLGLQEPVPEPATVELPADLTMADVADMVSNV